MRNASLTVTVVISILVACQSNSPEIRPAPMTTHEGMATSADGTSIHYSVHGAGPTTLVFVHGWSCDASDWSDQVDGLSSEFRMVTLDLAGHGRSDSTRTEWTYRGFGEDIVAVVEELDLDDVVLVGHSMGGCVILEAAILAPDRVALAIGVDTLADDYAEGDWDAFTDELRRDFIGVTDGWVRTMFSDAAPPNLIDRVATDMAAQAPEIGVATFAAGNHWGAERMCAAIEELPVPLSLILTTEFRKSVTLVEERADALPSLRIVEIPGPGHFLMLEAPTRFNDVLRSLVRELREVP